MRTGHVFMRRYSFDEYTMVGIVLQLDKNNEKVGIDAVLSKNSWQKYRKSEKKYSRIGNYP